MGDFCLLVSQYTCFNAVFKSFVFKAPHSRKGSVTFISADVAKKVSVCV